MRFGGRALIVALMSLIAGSAVAQTVSRPWTWDISSDFGPRDLDNGPGIAFDFHEGVDYNAAAGDTDLGTPIPAVESGNIIRIAKDRGAFWTIEVTGVTTGDNWLYGHIFRNNQTTIGDWELRFNAEHVNAFNPADRTNENIIIKYSGGTPVKILSRIADHFISDGAGGFLSNAAGQAILTRRFVNAPEEIAPMGDANAVNVPVHLHLGLNYPNDNPHYRLQHPPDPLPTATIISPTNSQAFGPADVANPVRFDVNINNVGAFDLDKVTFWLYKDNLPVLKMGTPGQPTFNYGGRPGEAKNTEANRVATANQSGVAPLDANSAVFDNQPGLDKFVFHQDISTLDEGQYEFRVKCKDVNDNDACLNTLVGFTVDGTSPRNTAFNIIPGIPGTPGNTTTKTPLLTATFVDDGVGIDTENFSVAIEGIPVQNPGWEIGSLTINIVPPPLDEGLNQIVYTIQDLAGNVLTHPESFFVDTIAPGFEAHKFLPVGPSSALTAFLPYPGVNIPVAFTNLNSISIITDDSLNGSGINSVKVHELASVPSLGPNDNSVNTSGLPLRGSRNFSGVNKQETFQIPDAANGLGFTLQEDTLYIATVDDVAGNVSQAILVVDRGPPEIEVIQDEESLPLGDLANGTQFRVTATDPEETGIHRISFYEEGVEVDRTDFGFPNPIGVATFPGDGDGFTLSDGATYRIDVHDYAGNVTSRSITIRRSPPTIALTPLSIVGSSGEAPLGISFTRHISASSLNNGLAYWRSFGDLGEIGQDQSYSNPGPTSVNNTKSLGVLLGEQYLAIDNVGNYSQSGIYLPPERTTFSRSHSGPGIFSDSNDMAADTQVLGNTGSETITIYKMPGQRYHDIFSISATGVMTDLAQDAINAVIEAEDMGEFTPSLSPKPGGKIKSFKIMGGGTTLREYTDRSVIHDPEDSSFVVIDEVLTSIDSKVFSNAFSYEIELEGNESEVFLGTVLNPETGGVTSVMGPPGSFVPEVDLFVSAVLPTAVTIVNAETPMKEQPYTSDSSLAFFGNVTMDVGSVLSGGGGVAKVVPGVFDLPQDISQSFPSGIGWKVSMSAPVSDVDIEFPINVSPDLSRAIVIRAGPSSLTREYGSFVDVAEGKVHIHVSGDPSGTYIVAIPQTYERFSVNHVNGEPEFSIDSTNQEVRVEPQAPSNCPSSPGGGQQVGGCHKVSPSIENFKFEYPGVVKVKVDAAELSAKGVNFNDVNICRRSDANSACVPLGSVTRDAASMTISAESEGASTFMAYAAPTAPGNPDVTPPFTLLSSEDGQFVTSGESIFLAEDWGITLAGKDTVTADAPTSAVSETFVLIDEPFVDPVTTPGTLVTSSFNLAEGSHTLRFYSKDASGNIESVVTQQVFMDATAPVTTVSGQGPLVTGVSGDLVAGGGTEVGLAALDPVSAGNAVGVDKTFLLINESVSSCGFDLEVEPPIDPFAPLGSCANPLFVRDLTLGEGTHILEYLSLDKVDNAEQLKISTVSVDITSPVNTMTIANGNVITAAEPLLSATLSDTVAGISTATLSITIDGSTVPASITHNAGADLGDIVSGRPIPKPLFGSSVLSFKDWVYVIGGFDGSSQQNTIYRAHVASDGSVGDWITEGQTLPNLHNDSSAVIHNGRLYVIGLFTPSVDFADINTETGKVGPFTSGEPYETGSDSYWTGAGVVQACGPFLYVMAGSPLGARVRVSRLDGDGVPGPWRDTDEPLPQSTGYMPVVERKGKLYVFGGRNPAGGTIHSEVWVGTPNNNLGDLTWTTAGSMPVGLVRHGAVAQGDLLVVFGGNTGGGGTDNIYTARFTESGQLDSWELSDKKLLAVNNSAHGAVANNHMIVTAGMLTIPGANLPNDLVNVASLGGTDGVPSEATIEAIPSAPLAEGSHSLTLAAEDRVGNGEETTISFTVDSVSPVVSSFVGAGKDLQATGLSWIPSARPAFTASFIDPAPGTGIDTAQTRLELDTVDVTLDAIIGGNSLTYTPSADLGEGPHNLTLTLFDLAGNETSVPIEFGVDTATPTNTAFTPEDGVVLGSAPVSLSAVFEEELSGLSTTTARFMIDGSTLLPTAVEFGGSADLGDIVSGTPIPKPLFGSSVLSFKDWVYVIGGFDGSSQQNTIYRAHVAADGTVGDWITEGQTLPNLHNDSSAVIHNGRLYVIGLFTPSVDFADILPDGSLGSFTTGNPYEGGESSYWTGAGVVQACGPFLYVMAGSPLGARVRVSRLDGDGVPGPWRDTDEPLPQSTGYMPVVERKGKLYVFGGRNPAGGTIHSEVWAGTPNNNLGDLTWTTAGSMPVGLVRHGAVAQGDLLVVFGGNTGGGGTDNIYTARFTESGQLDSWELSDKKLLAVNNSAHGAVANNHMIVTAGMLTIPGANLPNDLVNVAPLGGNGALTVSFSASSASLAEGSHAFRTEIEDLAGNVGFSESSFSVDLTPPESWLSVDGGSRTFGETLYVRGQFPISINAVDALAGVAESHFQLDAGGFNPFAAPFTLADGSHSVDFFSTDLVGNIEAAKQETVVVDKTAPPAVSDLGGISLSSTSVRLTFSGTEELLDAAARVHYGVDLVSPLIIEVNLSALTLGAARDVLIEGLADSTTYQFALFLRDTAGNWSDASNVAEIQTRVVSVSTNGVATITAPEPIAVEIVSIEVATEPFTVAVDEQAISPVTNEFYEFEEGLVFPPDDPAIISFSFDPTIIDSTSLSIYTYDDASMLWSSASVVNQTIVIVSANEGIISGEIFHTSLYAPFIFDLKPPLTVLSITGPTFNEFISTASAVVLTAVDQTPLGGTTAGIAETIYNGQTYSGPFFLPEGPKTITFHSVDKVGNVEGAKSESFTVDGTAPETTLSVSGSSIFITAEDELSLASTDAGSGVAETLLSIDGSAFAPPTGPFTLAQGIHVLSFYALDNVANAETLTKVNVGVDLENLVAEITSPTDEGTGICRVVQGVIRVLGTTSGNYTLEIDEEVFASGGAVEDGLLGSWDSSGITGEKIITLKVADVFGREATSSVTVFVGEPGRLVVLGRKKVIEKPHNIGVGPDGSFAVANTHNNEVRLYTSAGGFVARFGGKGKHKGSPKLQKPKGVTLDAAGNVFIADTDHHRILKLAADGSVLLELGRVHKGKIKKGNGEGEFDHPEDVALGSNGDIYVADTHNQRIQVLNAAGEFLRELALPPIPDDPDKKTKPKAIAVDAGGNVYVADGGGRRVLKLGPTGSTLLSLGAVEGLKKPEGVAVSPSGDCIFVSDRDHDTISRFDAQGLLRYSFGKKGKIDDKKPLPADTVFKKPLGLALGSDGRLWVADHDNKRVQAFGLPDGPTVVLTGESGGGLGLAAVNQTEEEDKEEEVAGIWVDAGEKARLEGKDRASLDVPEGALGDDEELTLSVAAADPLRLAAGQGSGLAEAGSAVEFGPSGTVFAEDVTITLPYDGDEDEDSLKIYYWNTETEEWDALNSTVNLAARTVSAKTNHFSLYQVLKPGALVVGAANPAFALGDVYVYPNPAVRGEKPTFHIEVGIADSVEIRVYDVAGRLVHSESMGGTPSVVNGKYAYRAAWNGRIASGVYLYVIQAKKGGHGDLRKTGKFAVVR